MNEEDAFIAAIVRDPDADMPRLVYADWLQERGDPRGEFIRVQCALAREETRSGLRYQELSAHQSELLRAHPEWAEPVEPFGDFGTNPDRLQLFRRGFIEALDLDAGTFLERGDDLFRVAPLLRYVRLFGLDGASARALADSSYLSRLVRLDLGGEPPIAQNQIRDAGVVALAGTAGLSQLAELGLAYNEVADDGARALASSPHVTGLTWLDLGDNRIGEGGVQALIESPHLTRLTRLGLRNNPGAGVPCHYNYDWGYGSPVSAEIDQAAADRLRTRFRREIDIF